MERSNDGWLQQLRAEGLEQKSALVDLRAALYRGLRGALWKWPQADEAFLEDTVQDSIIRILQKLDQFEGRSRFLTWAMAIAIRIAMSELRRKRWAGQSLDERLLNQSFPYNDSHSLLSGLSPTVETLSMQNQMIIQLYQRIVSDLTDKQRTALLAELKGMPQEEIAIQLGSNRNAVYKLTHDARKQLKRSLESAGFCADDIQIAFDR